MGKKYDRKSIENDVCKALKEDINSFYTNSFLQYTSNLIGEDVLAVDFIAELIYSSINSFRNIGGVIRKKPFYTGTHNGTTKGGEGENEKKVAIALYNSKNTNWKSFGKIIDYEVPLKELRKSKFGKIDIIAIKNDTIKLIELKIREETLLRAIIEIYTYYSLLKNTNSCERFIEDYKKCGVLDKGKDYKFQPIILADENSLCGKQIKEIANGGKQWPNLHKLIKEEFKFGFYTFNNEKLCFNDCRPSFTKSIEIKEHIIK